MHQGSQMQITCSLAACLIRLCNDMAMGIFRSALRHIFMECAAHIPVGIQRLLRMSLQVVDHCLRPYVYRALHFAEVQSDGTCLSMGCP
jgi:hypothetical protein